MKLSHIEVTVPIGRTERGQTLTVMDLLKAYAIATGTEIGSLEFDRALENPSQLHAKETLENAARFRTLRALAQNALERGGQITLSTGGECMLSAVSAEARQVGAERNEITIQLRLENAEDGLGLEKAIDAFNAGQHQT